MFQDEEEDALWTWGFFTPSIHLDQDQLKVINSGRPDLSLLSQIIQAT
jgi:hypothetical protein